MNNLENTLVLGGGHIGKRHINALNKIGSTVSIVDSNPNIDKEVLNSNTIYSSLKDVPDIDKNNFGIICLPNFLHFSYSKELIEAGLNVIVEKPMCLDINEARYLINLAQERDKSIFVVKQNRLVDSMIHLKNSINENAFGKLLSFSMEIIWNRDDRYFSENLWRGKKDLDGGSLYTQFSHYIDLVEWLFGDVKTTNGFKNNFLHKKSSETEDSICTSILLDSGVMGTMHFSINSYQNNLGNRFVLVFERGALVLEGSNFDEVSKCTSEACFNSNDLVQFFSAENIENAHDRFYFYLKEVLSGSKIDSLEFLATGKDGLQNLETIDLIYKNLK